MILISLLSLVIQFLPYRRHPYAFKNFPTVFHSSRPGTVLVLTDTWPNRWMTKIDLRNGIWAISISSTLSLNNDFSHSNYVLEGFQCPSWYALFNVVVHSTNISKNSTIQQSFLDSDQRLYSLRRECCHFFIHVTIFATV